ncbi:MAG: Uma2 family endonuclease [Gemmataceae bacterium]|nr:Uma2 family endonuclease [Gemmataceae bacterium]
MTALAAPALAHSPIGLKPMRWTCADFHRVGETGAFEGKRPILLDGVILEQGPMNPPHAITLALVDQAIRLTFGAGFWVRNQSPLVLGQYTDPMPDLAVIPGSPRDAVRHPKTASLVVEIADTSLDFDMGEKRLLYAVAGIPEYWVVDVNGRTLQIFRDPQNGDYRSRQSLTGADCIKPLSATSTVAVADLLCD